MKNLNKLSFLTIFILLSGFILAHSPKSNTYFAANCVRATAVYDLAVNNVRARLSNGGDLFAISSSSGGYITPANAGPAVSGIYTAGVWIGGVDRAGEIKLSAVTYKSEGSDFFAGPLDLNGTSENTICAQWDKIFSVKGTNIRQHIKNFEIAKENGTTLSCNDISDDILYWPAQGNPYFEEEYGWQLPDQTLAGYVDIDNNGYYDPCFGDFPMLYMDGCDYDKFIPTEINYFVFNDNGGPQRLSGPRSIQMEMHVNAFAYSTNDELNDMTFYEYKMTNKANEDLIDCYFAWWVDPDLGCYNDDYLGCDPDLGMAYIYNEDALDGFENGCQGVSTYGENIPIIGIDFFRGPSVTKVFKTDANGHFILDANGRKILMNPTPGSGQQDTLVEGGMSSFTFTYNQGGNIPDTGDPQRGREGGFYNLLRGMWTSGVPMTYGGDGFNPLSLDTVKYLYPDDPDDPNGWSMCTAKEPFADRKFIMSVGPMLMQTGASKTLTVGVFSSFGDKLPCPNLSKLRFANGVAQNFFDNCFDEFNESPEAPDITAISKNQEIVLVLDNDKTSNNYNEKFVSTIPNIPSPFDDKYRFEGYMVYQLANEKVRFDQLNDPTYAKLISQSDIKNNVSDIFNWNYVANPDTSSSADRYIWTKSLMVVGADQGLRTTFSVTEDLFATGDKTLINDKNYYFCAIAYAYNNWRQFDNIERFGQKKPFLTGSTNFKVYQFSPMKTFGPDDPRLKVTRISGEGNPHIFLQMDDDMYDKILSPTFDGKVNYKTGYGPIVGFVQDPSKINKNKYRLEITGTMNTNTCNYSQDAVWKLTDITNNDVLLEDKPLSYIKEYIINELGFSIMVENYLDPGENVYVMNGGIGAKLVYKDKLGPQWFRAVKDDGYLDGSTKVNKALDFVDDVNIKDPTASLSHLGDGFFVPFYSTKNEADVNVPFYLSPAAREVMAYIRAPNTNSLKYRDLNNVDIVFTSDKSKWSKCIVVETTFADYNNAGFSAIKDNNSTVDTKNFELRRSKSVDENGNEIANSTGFSYFPGYAVDVETGKRLNIFFGENSVYAGENAKYIEGNNPIGGDMIFNPSSEVVINDLKNSLDTSLHTLAYAGGGQHYIYVTRQAYDGCASFANALKRNPASDTGPSLIKKAKVASAVTWTSFPITSDLMRMSSIDKGLIPNDLIVMLRVDNTYSPSRIYDIDKERACTTDTDHPVYEFGFEDFESNVVSDNTLSRVSLSPNPAISSNGQLKLALSGLPTHALVQILDQNGQSKWQSHGDAGENIQYIGPGVTTTTFDMNGVDLHTGLYLIKITDMQTGENKSLKWIVF